MNLVFITIDGARHDFLLNSKVIQELMNQGTSFTDMVTYAPYTIAAMHAVVSGEYGFKTGVNSYWSTYKFKKEKYKTMAEYFQENGFKTFGDSINKLILPQQGFDELQIHDEDEDDLTKRHKDLLDKMKELEQSNKKFFLYLHYSNIHTGIKNNVLTKIDNFNEEYYKNKSKNEIRYNEYFEKAEKYIQDILQHAKNNNLVENTVFVIFSDHGISIGEKFGERAYGVFCYDYTVRNFALIIKDGIIPQKIISQQVRSIDILPTLLDIFNIKTSKTDGISGKTMLPIMKGDGDERVAIIESGNPLKTGKPPEESNVIAIRMKGWKLIVNLYDQTGELYNLKVDSKEENNIFDSNEKIQEELITEMIKIKPELSDIKIWLKSKLKE